MKQVLVVIGLAAAAAAASASRTLPAGYVHTPAGGMREDCVHAVPSGSELVDDGDAMAVVLNGRVVAKHPHCLGTTKTPVMAAALAGDKASGSLRGPPTLQRGLQLPPDYDGWIEYTAANVSDTYDAFLGFFSVPNTPPRVQNINWIPKVDPMPSQPFDILQPVLQYPADDRSDSWSIKSWYVTVNSGAYFSTEIKVQPGDNIFGNMTRLGPEQWLVNSVSSKTGQQTLIKPSHPRLAKQPWAYNTLECYGCQDCSTYPSNPTYFTHLALTCGGKPCPPSWRANPDMDPVKKCHEGLSIQDPATVTITFGAGSSSSDE